MLQLKLQLALRSRPLPAGLGEAEDGSGIRCIANQDVWDVSSSHRDLYEPQHEGSDVDCIRFSINLQPASTSG